MLSIPEGSVLIGERDIKIDHFNSILVEVV